MEATHGLRTALMAVGLCAGLNLLWIDGAKAAQVWEDCQPYRVAVFDGRAHTACLGNPTWYVVTYANHSDAFVNRFVAVTTAAIAANKPLKILYDNAVGSPSDREVLSVEMFK